eukprot:SAG31_NODE_43769_length_265_cov_1.253012_1_plen_77_part_10
MCLENVFRDTKCRCFIAWCNVVRLRRIAIRATRKLRLLFVARSFAAWQSNTVACHRERTSKDAREQRGQVAALIAMV